MNRYSVRWSKRADRSLSALPKDARERIWEDVSALSENPRPIGCKYLSSFGLWRIRIGDYRAIYEIWDKPTYGVDVLEVAHRKQIYLRFKR